MTDEQFEMMMTQAWIFMFGVSIGFVLTSRVMFWLPLFIVGVLAAYRIYVLIIFKRKRVMK